MLCQDTPAERIDFTHRGDLEPCTLQAKFKPADTGKEPENFHPRTFASVEGALRAALHSISASSIWRSFTLMSMLWRNSRLGH